jgi:diguanylate cyclase (GGDEF)-like protein
LTQALPLGVFQIDHERRIVYTNHRLFEVMGTTTTDTFDELVRWVNPDYREALTAALLEVIRGGGGCEIEVHLTVPGDERDRICQFTLHQLQSLAAPAHGVVGCVADVTERALLRRELEDRATFDALTRCYNRAAIMTRLEAALSADREDDTITAVLFIDLDLFKAVNDRFGHLVGDEFLTATASRIRGCLREDAALGRLGGDEFLIVLPHAAAAEADVIRDRVTAVLSRDITLSVGVIEARASVGVAISNGIGTTAESLVKQADNAMYQAKRQQTSADI